MATVTGALSDIGIQAFPTLQPRLIFTPSGPATAGTRVFATKPVIVPVNAGSGSFTVTLQDTDSLRPVAWYDVTIEWNQPGAEGETGYVPADFLQWKLFVPAAGGNFADLIETPANPSLIWVGDTAPAYAQPGQKWLYTGESNGTYIYGTLYELRG